MKHGVDCGGWCPEGRLDERGNIPARYPVRELAGGGFPERTMANVRDSDGTVLLYSTTLAGGTEYTAYCCRQQNKPHQMIDASKLLPTDAAKTISDFVSQHKIEVLNVAGPRASQWPNGYGFAHRALEIFLQAFLAQNRRPTHSEGLLPDPGERQNTPGSTPPPSK